MGPLLSWPLYFATLILPLVALSVRPWSGFDFDWPPDGRMSRRWRVRGYFAVLGLTLLVVGLAQDGLPAPGGLAVATGVSGGIALVVLGSEPFARTRLDPSSEGGHRAAVPPRVPWFRRWRMIALIVAITVVLPFAVMLLRAAYSGRA